MVGEATPVAPHPSLSFRLTHDEDLAIREHLRRTTKERRAFSELVRLSLRSLAKLKDPEFASAFGEPLPPTTKTSVVARAYLGDDKDLEVLKRLRRRAFALGHDKTSMVVRVALRREIAQQASQPAK